MATQILNVSGAPPLTLPEPNTAALASLTLYGHATQDTTTGAQLLQVKEGTTDTGLTYTIEDGVLYVEGTSTATGSAQTDHYLYGAAGTWETVSTFTVGNIAAGIDGEMPEDLTFYIVRRRSGASAIVATLNVSTKSATFEHQDGDTYRIMIRNGAAGTAHDHLPIKIMVNTGSTAKAWEPYTGAAISPSLDYPQDIIPAGAVMTTGAQLFDQVRAMTVAGWIGSGAYRHLDIDLKPNTTYTISMAENNMWRNEIYDTGRAAMYVGEAADVSGNGNTVIGNANVQQSSVRTMYTFTTSENPFYVNLFVNRWNVESLEEVFQKGLINFQIQEGSAALPYEPYTGGVPALNPDAGQIGVSVEGGNVFDVSKIITTTVISLQDSAIISTSWGGNLGVDCLPSLKPNTTYYIRGTVTMLEPVPDETIATAATTYTDKRLLLYRNASGDLAGYSGTMFNINTKMMEGETQVVTGTIKTPDDLTGLSVRIYCEYYKLPDGSAVSAKVEFSEILVSESPIADTDPYQPYYDPQTLTISTLGGLPGIPVTTGGNYTDANNKQWLCDEIDLARGVYVRRIGRVDMTDLDIMDSQIAASKRFFAIVSDSSQPQVRHPILSNRFAMPIPLTANADVGQAFLWGGRLYWYMPEEYTTAAQMMEWAQAHPTYFYYPLQTPVETPLTDEEIAVYKALHTHAGVTVVGNDADAWMDVGYRSGSGGAGKKSLAWYYALTGDLIDAWWLMRGGII